MAWLEVKKHIVWSVGNGNLNFWTDNWLGRGIFADFLDVQVTFPSLKVSEVLEDRVSIHDLHLPDRLMLDIIQFNFCTLNEMDQACWCLEPSGQFSVKSTWEVIRPHKNLHTWGEGIWDSFLPTKISFFLWRVFWNRLPSDDRISQMGVYLCSKCCCCGNNPQTETLQHLLFYGEWATRAWNSFLKCFDMGQKEDKS